MNRVEEWGYWHPATKCLECGDIQVYLNYDGEYPGPCCKCGCGDLEVGSGRIKKAHVENLRLFENYPAWNWDAIDEEFRSSTRPPGKGTGGQGFICSHCGAPNT